MLKKLIKRIKTLDADQLEDLAEWLDDMWPEDEVEQCPLCKVGTLSDDGGCSNGKCLVNKLGGLI